MGQKVHPLSLRIPSSFKTYSDLWYSSKDYTRLFLKKLYVEKYISAVLQQKGFPEAQISLAASSKSHRYLVSFLNPEESRKLKYSRYRLPRISKSKIRNLANVFLSSNKNINEIQDQMPICGKRRRQTNKISQSEILDKKVLNPSVVLKNLCFSGIQNPELKGILPHYIKTIQTSSPKSKKKKEQKVGKDISLLLLLQRGIKNQGTSSSLNKIIESYVKIPSNITLWMNSWESQHADFLAQEMTSALIQRVPFRIIKLQLIKEIEDNYKNQWSSVRGIRITCSGRGGSRSKKAQRAETLRFQWGQTSLHTFSEKIGFASRSALTSFGQTGVKVWICYK